MQSSFSASPPGAQACLLSSFGTDGLGHRIESALQCIGVAAELGLQYVHQPFSRLAHGVSAERAEAFFNLQHVFPTLSRRHKLAKRTPTNYHVRTPTIAFRCASNATAEPIDWLDFVAAGKVDCRADGATVYDDDNCGGRFYCTTVPQRPEVWFGVLPRLQHAYWEAPKPATVFAHVHGARSAPGHETTNKAPMTRSTIHVAVHVRLADVGPRIIGLAYFKAAMAALRARHAGSRVAHTHGLRFHVHSNGSPIDLHRGFATAWYPTPGSTGAVATPPASRASLALAARAVPRTVRSVRAMPLVPADVSIVVPNLTEDRTAAALGAFHSLANADLLVASRSSLSFAAALLGNHTALIPACYDRTPLPHWYLLPCADLNALHAAILRLPWPPSKGSTLSRARQHDRAGAYRPFLDTFVS